MTNIALLCVCLCLGIVALRRRRPPAATSPAQDGVIAFVSLPPVQDIRPRREPIQRAGMPPLLFLFGCGFLWVVGGMPLPPGWWYLPGAV